MSRQWNSRGSYNPKTEPRAKAINPGAVAQLGTTIGNHVSDGPNPNTGYRGEKWKAGRGFNAPHDDARCVHKSGSQGKR